MSEPSLYDELLTMVPADLHRESGEVFHSGRSAFEKPSRIYLLGLNPGGADEENVYTIARVLDEARTRRSEWSAYSDEPWGNYPAGAHPYQRSVLHLLKECGLDPHGVPASNVIFSRTARASGLGARKAELADICWPVHKRVIDALDVRVVVCFGQDAGSWVRQQLGAVGQPVDSFTEDNRRKWISTTHVGRDGTRVVTLTHPSIARWTVPKSDPTGLVVRALAATEEVQQVCESCGDFSLCKWDADREAWICDPCD